MHISRVVEVAENHGLVSKESISEFFRKGDTREFKKSTQSSEKL